MPISSYFAFYDVIRSFSCYSFCKAHRTIKGEPKETKP